MATSNNSSKKDVIYVDVDDEITGIIDKVRSSDGRIVALVLPKRASVMQSIVNMKLLKRTAHEAKKHVVLITSETGLLPLAGIAGVHVANSLQSKPEIPAAPAAPDDVAVIAADTGEPDVAEPAIDSHKSVGELSGDDDSIEVDNDDPEPSLEAAAATESAQPKVPFNKKLKVPNFDSFRTRLLIGVSVFLVLVFGWIMAFHVMPRATIVVKTDTTTLSSELALTGSTTAQEANEQNAIVPAVNKELKKTDSQKAAATGQKDKGTKSTGTLTLTNCINDGQPHTVPAGTGFSSGQYTFITDEDVTLQPAVYSASNCRSAALGFNRNVGVTAAQAGGQYNLSARSYTSPASLSTSSGSVSAQGSSMTGGTSNIVKIVSQEDVDTLRQKIVDGNNGARDELSKQLKDSGYIALADTFTAGNPLLTASPNVGDEASEVTVNVTTTFTMFGAKKDAVKQLLEANIKKKIDTTKQTVLDNGLDKATIKVGDKAKNQVTFTLGVNAAAGVQQDSDAIKQAVAGKKKSEVQEIILKRPGIKDVTVTYSPFWVYSTPGSAKKITVTFEQQNGTKSE